jgi:hypothetical protein
LSLDGDVAVVGAVGDDDNGSFSGSAYIYRWSGSNWVEEQKLTASDGAAEDWFGLGTTIKGDLAVVGANYGDGIVADSGAAYVYRWNGTSWVEEQKLIASDGGLSDRFGFSSAIKDDMLLIGSYYHNSHRGAVYVFRWNGSSWIEEQKLTPSDTSTGDDFGFSMDLSGDVLLVGANNKDNMTGAAYVFRWNGTNWVEEQKLAASDGDMDDEFGFSVSIDGDVAVIGSVHQSFAPPGSAYIFRYNGSSWVEEQKLTASDGRSDDRFGISVSVEGNIALVGACGYDDTGSFFEGAAYVFEWNGSSWVEQQKLTTTDGTGRYEFGRRVSMNGNYVMVSAYMENGDGAVYAFAGDTTPPTGTVAINSDATYCTDTNVTLALNSPDADYMSFSNDNLSFSVWESYSDSKSWTLMEGDGTKTVYVQLKDEVGNTRTICDNIILDTTLPSGNIEINNGDSHTAESYVSLTLSSSDAVSMSFSNDGLTFSAWELYLDTKIWTLSEGDGTKTVYVKYKDEAGNTFVVTYTIILDTTPPSAAIVINNGDSHTAQMDVSLTLSLLEEDGTDVSGEITTDIVWDLAGSPYTLVGDLQINNGVRLTIEDGVVVNNPDSYQILLYGTIQAEAVLNNPVVFNGVKVNVASAGTVIFDYVEFNQGHIRNDLGFEHFTITNCRFNETSYLRINARTDSYFDRNTLTDAGYVELIANTSSHDRDIYARWNSFYGKHPTLALKSCFKVSYEGSDRLVIHSNNFLDENNYGISLHFNTSIVDATNNYWGSTDPAVIAARINDSNDNPSILGTVLFDPFADVPYPIPPSSSAEVYMSFSNDGLTFSAWEPYLDSKAWTLSDGDGTKEVFARLKDEAGNISTVSDSILLDTTAPTSTIAIEGGSDYCAMRNVSLVLNSADAAFMQFSNDGTSYSTWESYSDSKTWTLSDGDGVKEVFARLKDEAGNISTVSDSIILDTTTPTGSFAIGGGSDYCVVRDVSLALDSANAAYMQFSNDGVTYSVWEPYTASKDWLLTVGEGVKSVYVKLKDEAGNVSTFNDTIVLDATAPTGNLTINDGDNYATTGEVTLTLNTDNASYMCFSNDGITYSDYEPYSESKTWTLSEGEGSKTVYVKYKDEAGNTFVVSHSIILDSIAPDAPILIELAVIDNNQPTLDWEVVSGADYYVLEYADNPNFDNSILVDAIGPSEYTIETPLDDGSWYWRVMSVDLAGNESEWSVAEAFRIDTTQQCIEGPEKPVLLSPANGAIDVSLTPVLTIQAPIDTPVCNYPLKVRWRISKDSNFKGLVARVNSESKDLTRYQPSELILEPDTTYYWKVRFLGSQGNKSEWSSVFSFTTQPPAGDDVNINGIPDEQEVDEEDDLDDDGIPDNDQDDEIKSFKAKKGNLKLGMRSSDGDIVCVKALDDESVDNKGNKPDQVLYGLWSYRVEVAQYGAIAKIKVFLSEPAPENATVAFYDELDGWQDFSEHAIFNATRRQVTVELKDGGYGDNDHTENKIIVDPSGIGIFDAGSLGGSSSGGSCFISTVLP